MPRARVADVRAHVTRRARRAARSCSSGGGHRVDKWAAGSKDVRQSMRNGPGHRWSARGVRIARRGRRLERAIEGRAVYARRSPSVHRGEEAAYSLRPPTKAARLCTEALRAMKRVRRARKTHDCRSSMTSRRSRPPGHRRQRPTRPCVLARRSKTRAGTCTGVRVRIRRCASGQAAGDIQCVEARRRSAKMTLAAEAASAGGSRKWQCSSCI